MGDYEHGYAMIIRGRQAAPLEVAPPVQTIVETLRAFVYALQHDEPPPISALDGLQTVEIAEACYDAATGQQAVEIYDEDEEDDLQDDLAFEKWDD
jgi:predicted dehydrogenase